MTVVKLVTLLAFAASTLAVPSAKTTTAKAKTTTTAAAVSSATALAAVDPPPPAGYSLTPHAVAEQPPAPPTGWTWPTMDVPPAPRPEWLTLFDMSKIPNAPLTKVDANGDPLPDGYTATATNNPYCSWTIGMCTRPEDVSYCPKGVWGLTYDDGPQPPSLPLYKFLADNNQTATHFIIGSRALEYPSTLKQIYSQGGQIAVHTWSHPWMTSLTNEQIIGEIMWTTTVIKQVTGITPRYFRPPHGDVDDRVRYIIKALGFINVLWNHDTEDWQTNVPGTTFQASWIVGNITQWAQSEISNANGIITLEHELSDASVAEAMNGYNIMKANNWIVQNVATCLGDTRYYLEQPAPANTTATNSTTSPKSADASDAAKNGVAKTFIAPSLTIAAIFVGLLSVF